MQRYHLVLVIQLPSILPCRLPAFAAAGWGERAGSFVTAWHTTESGQKVLVDVIWHQPSQSQSVG